MRVHTHTYMYTHAHMRAHPGKDTLPRGQRARGGKMSRQPHEKQAKMVCVGFRQRIIYYLILYYSRYNASNVVYPPLHQFFSVPFHVSSSLIPTPNALNG